MRALCSRPWLVVALVTCAIEGGPAHATSVTVPDDTPTIQGALDVLPDTVLVRSGSYPETLVLFAQVALVGLPGYPTYERPIVMGMSLGSIGTLAS